MKELTGQSGEGEVTQLSMAGSHAGGGGGELGARGHPGEAGATAISRPAGAIAPAATAGNAAQSREKGRNTAFLPSSLPPI